MHFCCVLIFNTTILLLPAFPSHYHENNAISRKMKNSKSHNGKVKSIKKFEDFTKTKG